MRARSSVVARLSLLAGGLSLLMLGGCNDVLGIREPSFATLDEGGDAGSPPSEPPPISSDPTDAGADARVHTDPTDAGADARVHTDPADAGADAQVDTDQDAGL